MPNPSSRRIEGTNPLQIELVESFLGLIFGHRFLDSFQMNDP